MDRRNANRLLVGRTLATAAALTVALVPKAQQDHEKLPTPKPVSLEQIAKEVGSTDLNGCDLSIARRQIRARVLDQKKFSATILYKDGYPVFSAVQVGKNALIGPLVLTYNNQPVALAGLANPMRAIAKNTYDPVRIYQLGQNSSLSLPAKVSLASTTLHYVRDNPLPQANIPGLSITVMKGFASNNGLTYGVVTPEPVGSKDPGNQTPGNNPEPGPEAFS